MSQLYPLHFWLGHLFLEADGALWLLDTGGPSSFGEPDSITLAGRQFRLRDNYGPLTADSLSDFVGVQCAGLVGADILNEFDVLIDVPGGTVTFSEGEMAHPGKSIPLDFCMGIPIVSARVGEVDYRMFFDTGAQISYFQDDSITDYPPDGIVDDFYPDVGRFQTQTYCVPVSLGSITFTLRCGTLPKLLGETLMMADTRGIIGNKILVDRAVGYFPRRRSLVL